MLYDADARNNLLLVKLFPIVDIVGMTHQLRGLIEFNVWLNISFDFSGAAVVMLLR